MSSHPHSASWPRWTTGLILLAGILSTGCQMPGGVRTYRTSLTIPTDEWGPHDINPRFEPAGGMSIYPYPMQDNLGREKKDKAYEALVLENEYLRVTVLPELGGHVHSVYDKAAGREMFYVNQVIKPGLIGMAGAWISGGIEFNTGPLGHTVTAVYPVACRFVDHGDGSRAIAIGHVERIYRTQWTAEVSLRPGRRFLEERIRLFNPNSTPQWYYFWNCTAVPNTDGTQFIYPMKLGTDHGYTTFFPWPVHDGKDYSWSKNYDAPTGPFAYECDQDFFGSYDHDVNYGVVAIANHHQVKGKKGWTWGRGGEGITAMANLTDDGTWYNEVQTGPLQTQVDVAPFGPHQTIEWKEWWYPVHEMSGFEYATKDVAVNVFPTVPFNGEAKEPVREIRIAATGRFADAVCIVSKDGKELLRQSISLRPESPTQVLLSRPARTEPPGAGGSSPSGADASSDGAQSGWTHSAGPIHAPIHIEIKSGGQTLASFTHPLPLPDRTPPEKPAKDETAAGLWRDGIREQSNGNLAAARAKYDEALQKQPDFVPAAKSLATMDLDAGLYEAAAKRLEAALKITPEDGLLHVYLAESALAMDDDVRALDEAWKAARISETAAVGLNLAAQVYVRLGRWPEADDAVGQSLRADSQDVSSWTLLGLVKHQTGRRSEAAAALAEASERDPLDPLAAGLVNLIGSDGAADAASTTGGLLSTQDVLEAAARLVRLRQYEPAMSLLKNASGSREPIVHYYAAGLLAMRGGPGADREIQRELAAGDRMPLDYVFPHRREELTLFNAVLKRRPGHARLLYLKGNLLFARHRHAEARVAWDEAAGLGLEYSVLYRNIAFAKDKLDKDTDGAIAAYEQAHRLNPHDLVVTRDLGRLYTRAGKWEQAVALLEKSLAEAIHRSDVTEDLVRAYEHLDQLDKAAALLDARTFNAWEGQQSMHNIFETVHRKLGERAMERKDYATAIRAFGRSLEYPQNLGVGRPKGKSQAAGLYALGEACAAAGRTAEAREAWKRAADEGERGGEPARKAAAALKAQP